MLIKLHINSWQHVYLLYQNDMVPPEKNEVRFRTSVLNMGLLICPTTGGDKLTEEGTD